ncbi:hypothetical protein DF268_34290 [Streptomyces sp. V2]|nr:hypothetical protein DF268_34290 [Streptomyces sp. V2]
MRIVSLLHGLYLHNDVLRRGVPQILHAEPVSNTPRLDPPATVLLGFGLPVVGGTEHSARTRVVRLVAVQAPGLVRGQLIRIMVTWDGRIGEEHVYSCSAITCSEDLLGSTRGGPLGRLAEATVEHRADDVRFVSELLVDLEGIGAG